MRILVTGASGFIGSHLVQHLRRVGHEAMPLRRGPANAAGPTWDPGSSNVSLASAGPLDAVVHLAGHSIACRWTAVNKRRIRDSRVRGTRLLCEAVAALEQRPRVLVCASATGLYGNRGDEWLTEESAAGAGFLADVAQAWERAAEPARQAGLRVVHPRIGLVLSPTGGALRKMLPAFRLGLGGRVGNGRQYWSWIELDDLLRALERMLEDDSLSGPINAVSPHPATNGEFTQALGRALRRPTVFPLPAWAARLLFGEMADEALLASARVRPARLLEAGFEFLKPRLEDAFSGHFKHPGPWLRT